MSAPFVIAGTGTSVYSTVTIASQQLTLIDGQRYVITSTTNAWIALGTNPTASAGAANMTYMPAGVPMGVQVQAGYTKLAIIRDSADGKVTATVLV